MVIVTISKNSHADYFVLSYGEEERCDEDEEECGAGEADEFALVLVAAASVGLGAAEVHHQIGGEEEARDEAAQVPVHVHCREVREDVVARERHDDAHEEDQAHH